MGPNPMSAVFKEKKIRTPMDTQGECHVTIKGRLKRWLYKQTPRIGNHRS